jgi:indoleamine 2,3-dioxygenase
LKHTHHPVATGGSPIVTWLPNQLKAVLESQQEVIKSIKNPSNLPAELKKEFIQIKTRVNAQKRVLIKEVEKLRKDYPGQDY